MQVITTLCGRCPGRSSLSPLAAGIAVVGLAVLGDAVMRARRLHRQRTLRNLATLSWQQFEEVIADAFRRHGFLIREVGGCGRADGGVDLILTRGGQRPSSRRSSGGAIGPVSSWCANSMGVASCEGRSRDFRDSIGSTPRTPCSSPRRSA